MRRVTIKIAFILVLLITTASVATPTYWHTLAPGLEYTKISMLSGFRAGSLHAFRINLAFFNVELAIAEDVKNKIATVADLTKANHGVIGVNGGFFSQELKPLGLRIAHYKQRNPIKSTPWWGVFYIENGKPHIVNQRNFKKNKEIEFAIQSGPRLVVNGKIPLSLKPGMDSRTALGITKNNDIILVATENLRLTTTQLASVMLAFQIDGGLGCVDALNLDGGSSTQLYASFKNFYLDIAGYSAVTDAIIVVPR
jgi:uncharacterized protein YigE (DUF2233 family)